MQVLGLVTMIPIASEMGFRGLYKRSPAVST